MFKVPISLDLPKAATWPCSSISLLSGRSEYILNYMCTLCFFVLSCKKRRDGFHDWSLHCQLWTWPSLQVSVSSSWKKVSYPKLMVMSLVTHSQSSAFFFPLRLDSHCIFCKNFDFFFPHTELTSGPYCLMQMTSHPLLSIFCKCTFHGWRCT